MKNFAFWVLDSLNKSSINAICVFGACVQMDRATTQSNDLILKSSTENRSLYENEGVFSSRKESLKRCLIPVSSIGLFGSIPK